MWNVTVTMPGSRYSDGKHTLSKAFESEDEARTFYALTRTLTSQIPLCNVALVNPDGFSNDFECRPVPEFEGWAINQLFGYERD